MAVSTIALTNTFDEWRIQFNAGVAVQNAQLDSTVLATLTTTVNATLVGAINELDGEIGDLSSLTTTATSSLVAAINEIDSAVSGFAELASANTFTQNQTIDKAGAIGILTVGSDRDTGQTTQIDARGHNSVGADKIYAEIAQTIIDNTDTSEDGSWTFRTMQNGTLGVRMTLAGGLYMAGATGGDQGAGTGNFTAVYLNGTDITSTFLSGNSGVTAGSYTKAHITVDVNGRVTAASNGEGVASEYTKTQNFDGTTLTDAATIAWNLEDNQVATVTLAGNRTLGAPTNMKDGATYILVVKQDATGTRTLAYNAVFKFPGGTAPTLSTGTNEIDILTFYCDGTNMYGVFQGDFS